MLTARSFVVALSLTFAAGCKDKAPVAKQAPVVLDAAARPVDAAPPVIDAGPPPLTPPPPGGRGVQIVDLEYGGFAQPGLPAIKADGSAIAVTSVADDGGRGYLDLRFVVLDGATGKALTTIQLVEPEETSAAIATDDAAGNLDAEEALYATVRERVAKANAMLAEGTWRPLETVERADSGPPRPMETITAGDVAFTYDLAARRLSVARAGLAAPPHELAKLVPRPKTGTDVTCPGDLYFLGAVHLDPPGSKAVVELTPYAQGHNCGGGGAIFTVVPLP
jgi:hypothetical protein